MPTPIDTHPLPPGDRPSIECLPATPHRWDDLAALFGPKGACGGCWCQVWRGSRAEFVANKGEGNRHALKQLVEGGPPPGVLAYQAGRAIGWCAVAPRLAYAALARSRTLAPVDDEPVWSITCLYVAKAARGRGVSRALIAAAADLARAHGALIVEAYPIDGVGKQPDVFVWTGLLSVFLDAGFDEVARRSRTRPIVRKRVGGHARPQNQ